MSKENGMCADKPHIREPEKSNLENLEIVMFHTHKQWLHGEVDQAYKELRHALIQIDKGKGDRL